MQSFIIPTEWWLDVGQTERGMKEKWQQQTSIHSSLPGVFLNLKVKVSKYLFWFYI